MSFEGELVRLRTVRDEDHDDIVAIETDPEGQRLANDEPPLATPAEVREWLSGVLAKDTVHLFAVERLDDGGFLGTCGMGVDARSRVGEVGISLRRSSWGTGVGTDAMRVLVEIGFSELNLERVWLAVFSTNERAIASYRKVGFVEEGRWREDVWRDGRYVDHVVMAVLRDEWSPSGRQ